MSKVILPDYENCPVNIMASIAKHFGVNSKHVTIKELDKVLAKNYKNVVLMIFDGLGDIPLAKALPDDSFLRSHQIKTLTSVYPSSTTPAMTSYITGQTPLEHGWLARNAYFKEVSAIVSLYVNTDAYSHKEACKKTDVAECVIPHKSVLERILEKNPDTVRAYSLYPPQTRGNYGHTQLLYSNLEEMMSFIQILTETQERKMIFAYNQEPDNVIHDFGTNSRYVVDVVENIERRVRALYESCRNTLFIITADHGLTNMRKQIDLRFYKDIDKHLIMPPSMEDRGTTFFVRPEGKKAFKEAFLKHFGDKFLLYSKKEVLDKELFGIGTPHKKISEFLGDYFAIGISDQYLTYSTLHEIPPYEKKGNHSGLTAEEMLIPLIILEKR